MLCFSVRKANIGLWISMKKLLKTAEKFQIYSAYDDYK